jgi:hypothetical protein
MDRRTALLSSVVSPSLFLYIHPHNHPVSSQQPDLACRLILEHCPASFRRAVRDAQGSFLYRGSDDQADEDYTTATLCSPKPDLLSPGTYADDDGALRFFQSLEQQLSRLPSIVSVGHLGTSDIAVAAQWGRPVSIWPLCQELTFLWPRRRPLFYPTTTNSITGDDDDDDYCIHQDLATALSSHDREVMFARVIAAASTDATSKTTTAPCSFLAVASRYDNSLRKRLEQCAYGLTDY